MKGQVIRVISKFYYVKINNQEFECHIPGILKNKDNLPIVGDYVEIVKNNDKYMIQKIYDQKNCLIRPRVANIDIAILVISMKEPNFNFSTTNRHLFFLEYQSIKPILLLTKTDLCIQEEVNKIISFYSKLNYDILTISNKNTKRDNIENIINISKNKLVAFVGQSGNGKSSTINTLFGKKLLKTNKISKALNRGTHTTTFNQVLNYKDCYFIDTPGYSSFYWKKIIIKDSYNTFNIFKQNAHKCQFNNCQHIHEKKCYIKDIFNNQLPNEFYQDYLKIIKDIKENNKKW